MATYQVTIVGAMMVVLGAFAAADGQSVRWAGALLLTVGAAFLVAGILSVAFAFVDAIKRHD